MPTQDDKNEKRLSRRDQDKQSGRGSQNTSQNKSNTNREQDTEPRSKSPQQNADGEHHHATDEEMARDKEMD